MDAANPLPRDTQHEIPKENAHPLSATSPPPAYTPRRILDIPSLAARGIQLSQAAAQQMARDPAARTLSRPLLTTMLNGQDDELEDSDVGEGSSPISLRINTSVNVAKNNNVVCLPDTPADHANAIARAVVQAIQENSSGQCGIPMIDEEGRPRPVKIEVDAGVVVDGEGNVVGNEDLVGKVLRQRGMLRRRREGSDGLYDGDESPAKRRRGTE